MQTFQKMKLRQLHSLASRTDSHVRLSANAPPSLTSMNSMWIIWLCEMPSALLLVASLTLAQPGSADRKIIVEYKFVVLLLVTTIGGLWVSKTEVWI